MPFEPKWPNIQCVYLNHKEISIGWEINKTSDAIVHNNKMTAKIHRLLEICPQTGQFDGTQMAD